MAGGGYQGKLELTEDLLRVISAVSELGKRDPHPPDGEGGKRRHLHGLAGGLEAQIAADLGRFRLLP